MKGTDLWGAGLFGRGPIWQLLVELDRADRPFLFVILHERTGTVLSVGRVGTPLSVE